MKKLLALFLLSVAPLLAQSENIDLGSHGKITFYHDESWKFEIADYGDRRIITVAPKGEANASCAFTITFPEQDRLDTKRYPDRWLTQATTHQ